MGEFYAPGTVGSEVASRHEIAPQLRSAWRKAARHGLLRPPDGTEPMNPTTSLIRKFGRMLIAMPMPKALRRFLPSTVAFTLYVLVSVWFFSPIPDLRGAYAGVGGDPLAFIWALHWWPWALAHGMNPFVTKFIWYPQELNLTWVTSIPTAAFLMLPVTLMWNAVVSWNVIALLAPALGAWAAFLLARQITWDFGAALVGGYIYGFSTYEVAHLHGHMNLYMTFIPPLLVVLALLRLRDGLGRITFIVAAAVLLLLQLGLSTEILATTCIFGAIAWLAFIPFVDADGRWRLWRLGCESGVAIALTVLIAAPFLYYVAVGIRSLPNVILSPQDYSIDLLNFLVPTPITALGKSVFASIAMRFAGNYSESSGYLGLPLIVALAASFQSPARYRLPLGILVLLFAIFSLGPSLGVNGVQTGIWLPWRIGVRLPIIRHAMPARFTMFLFLLCAVVLTRWLAERCSEPAHAARYALVLLGCLFLWPVSIPWTRLPTNSFFAPDTIARELPPGENVIILPFNRSGFGMLWQVQSGMYFTQTGGYFGTLPTVFAPDTPIIAQLISGRPGRTFAYDLAGFVASNYVRDVLAAAGTPRRLLEELTALGWPERTVGDMRIFHVPAEGELRYGPIVKGDYWGTTGEWSWMGRHIAVITHNRAARLHVKGSRFTGNGGRIALHVTINGTATGYSADEANVLTLDVEANARVDVETAQTFVPDEVIHNGDRRHLGALIWLQPL